VSAVTRRLRMAAVKESEGKRTTQVFHVSLAGYYSGGGSQWWERLLKEASKHTKKRTGTKTGNHCLHLFIRGPLMHDGADGLCLSSLTRGADWLPGRGPRKSV